MADSPEQAKAQLRAGLEARARAGEWLRPGDAAKLLDVSRSTMLRRLDDGTVGWRMHAGGHQRRCNPEDVLRELGKSRTERHGEMPDPQT